MNKKAMGGWAIVLLVILSIFVIIGFVTLLIVLNQNPAKKQITIVSEESFINLYLDAKDLNSGTRVDGKYSLLNESSILSGKLFKDSYAEINNLSNNLSYPILGYSDGFYSRLLNRSFTKEEKELNVSKMSFFLNKIGKLSVTNTGNIDNAEKLIVLNISSRDYFQKTEICVSWTSGIVSVESEPQLLCDSWMNISKDVYVCGDIQETCKEVIGSVCYPKQKEIPNRFRNTVDKCFYYGNNFHDNSIEIPFRIKSDNLNSLDYVEFVIFDNDLIYTNKFEYLSEFGNQNLGTTEDFRYTIKYNETF